MLGSHEAKCPLDRKVPRRYAPQPISAWQALLGLVAVSTFRSLSGPKRTFPKHSRRDHQRNVLVFSCSRNRSILLNARKPAWKNVAISSHSGLRTKFRSRELRRRRAPRERISAASRRAAVLSFPRECPRLLRISVGQQVIGEYCS